MVHFLVHGFPHCGTTIVRAILGNCPNIYEYPYESESVEDIQCFAKGRPVLIKCPFTKPAFFGDAYNQYVKIFMIRNPYYVFTSLNERFEWNIPANHSIEAYLETAKLFLHYTREPRADVLCMKYEDLFQDEFRRIRSVFETNNIPYTDDVFNTTNRNRKVVPGMTVPSSKPCANGERNHATYRTWQINQPFQYTDGSKAIRLSPLQRKQLETSPIVQELGYVHP